MAPWPRWIGTLGRRLARARHRAQGGELRRGRRGEFGGRLRRVFVRLLLSRPADRPGQRPGVDRRRHRLIRDEFADHLRPRIRPRAAPQVVSALSPPRRSRACSPTPPRYSSASYFMPVLVGKVLAIGASFLVNFSLSHFVVFRRARPTALEHDPEKWEPVFGKDHAQTRS